MRVFSRELVLSMNWVRGINTNIGVVDYIGGSFFFDIYEDNDMVFVDISYSFLLCYNTLINLSSTDKEAYVYWSSDENNFIG